MTDVVKPKKSNGNGRRKRKTKAKTTTKKATKPKKRKVFDEAKFCKKYKHVVPGSVKDAKVGSTVDGLKVTHPRICKIKCLESGKLRTIHTQDAWQCKYTEEIQAKKARERAANRRKKKKTNKK